jgi:hypothetical protein
MCQKSLYMNINLDFPAPHRHRLDKYSNQTVVHVNNLTTGPIPCSFLQNKQCLYFITVFSSFVIIFMQVNLNMPQLQQNLQLQK